MGERFPLQLRIGGEITESTVEKFMEIFYEAAWISANGLDSRQLMKDFINTDTGCFDYDQDECSPRRWTPLLDFCIENDLSWFCQLWSDGVECPDHRFWLPGMEKAAWAALTMEGEEYVSKDRLDEHVERYCVSAAEFRRALQHMIPPDVPEIPPLKVMADE